MKKISNLKAFALSLAMAIGMLLPMTTNAQSDGFFRSFNDNYENRDGGINDNNGGMTNQTFETPLGGGIAILLAAGLGYVVLKKKEDE